MSDQDIKYFIKKLKKFGNPKLEFFPEPCAWRCSLDMILTNKSKTHIFVAGITTWDVHYSSAALRTLKYAHIANADISSKLRLNLFDRN